MKKSLLKLSAVCSIAHLNCGMRTISEFCKIFAKNWSMKKNAMKILKWQILTEMECNVHRFRNVIMNAEINKCDNK